MSAIISGLVGGVVAVGLTAYIVKRVGKAKVPGRLQFGAFMWVLGAACLLLALLPVVISVVYSSDKDLFAKIALFVGF